jgi:hypothetical protein
MRLLISKVGSERFISYFLDSLLKGDWDWYSVGYLLLVFLLLGGLWHLLEKANPTQAKRVSIMVEFLILINGDLPAGQGVGEFIEIPSSPEDGEVHVGAGEEFIEIPSSPEDGEVHVGAGEEFIEIPSSPEEVVVPTPTEGDSLWEGLEPLPEASYIPQEEEGPPPGPLLDPEEGEQPTSSVDPTLRDSEAGERGGASPLLWEIRREPSPTTGPLRFPRGAPTTGREGPPVMVEIISSPETTAVEEISSDSE